MEISYILSSDHCSMALGLPFNPEKAYAVIFFLSFGLDNLNGADLGLMDSFPNLLLSSI